MKTIAMSLSAALFMMVTVTNASAVTCAEGVRRAGCAGPNGAVAVRKPVAAVPPKAVVVAPAPKPVVVAPAHACRYVNGVRVCR
ncbi:MAG: hypothetical protein JNM42_19220 [Propionivibrio sp.]|uniref:hypothetical protein n=1 Tax=Propionivibrio sp. TaxID=2212460 RepID=UPI001A398CF9|nr:hypothetical protein [Propionivibrio sp.]MBL8416561.1 hypothetical protein [Propionivibrio sp.]